MGAIGGLFRRVLPWITLTLILILVMFLSKDILISFVLSQLLNRQVKIIGLKLKGFHEFTVDALYINDSRISTELHGIQLSEGNLKISSLKLTVHNTQEASVGHVSVLSTSKWEKLDKLSQETVQRIGSSLRTLFNTAEHFKINIIRIENVYLSFPYLHIYGTLYSECTQRAIWKVNFEGRLRNPDDTTPLATSFSGRFLAELKLKGNYTVLKLSLDDLDVKAPSLKVSGISANLESIIEDELVNYTVNTKFRYAEFKYNDLNLMLRHLSLNLDPYQLRLSISKAELSSIISTRDNLPLPERALLILGDIKLTEQHYLLNRSIIPVPYNVRVTAKLIIQELPRALREVTRLQRGPYQMEVVLKRLEDSKIRLSTSISSISESSISETLLQIELLEDVDSLKLNLEDLRWNRQAELLIIGYERQQVSELIGELVDIYQKGRISSRDLTALRAKLSLLPEHLRLYYRDAEIGSLLELSYSKITESKLLIRLNFSARDGPVREFYYEGTLSLEDLANLNGSGLYHLKTTYPSSSHGFSNMKLSYEPLRELLTFRVDLISSTELEGSFPVIQLERTERIEINTIGSFTVNWTSKRREAELLAYYNLKSRHRSLISEGLIRFHPLTPSSSSEEMIFSIIEMNRQLKDLSATLLVKMENSSLALIYDIEHYNKANLIELKSIGTVKSCFHLLKFLKTSCSNYLHQIKISEASGLYNISVNRTAPNLGGKVYADIQGSFNYKPQKLKPLSQILEWGTYNLARDLTSTINSFNLINLRLDLVKLKGKLIAIAHSEPDDKETNVLLAFSSHDRTEQSSSSGDIKPNYELKASANLSLLADNVDEHITLLWDAYLTALGRERPLQEFLVLIPSDIEKLPLDLMVLLKGSLEIGPREMRTTSLEARAIATGLSKSKLIDLLPRFIMMSNPVKFVLSKFELSSSITNFSFSYNPTSASFNLNLIGCRGDVELIPNVSLKVPLSEVRLYMVLNPQSTDDRNIRVKQMELSVQMRDERGLKLTVQNDRLSAIFRTFPVTLNLKSHSLRANSLDGKLEAKLCSEGPCNLTGQLRAEDVTYMELMLSSISSELKLESGVLDIAGELKNLLGDRIAYSLIYDLKAEKLFTTLWGKVPLYSLISLVRIYPRDLTAGSCEFSISEVLQRGKPLKLDGYINASDVSYGRITISQLRALFETDNRSYRLEELQAVLNYPKGIKGILTFRGTLWRGDSTLTITASGKNIKLIKLLSSIGSLHDLPHNLKPKLHKLSKLFWIKAINDNSNFYLDLNIKPQKLMKLSLKLDSRLTIFNREAILHLNLRKGISTRFITVDLDSDILDGNLKLRGILNPVKLVKGYRGRAFEELIITASNLNLSELGIEGLTGSLNLELRYINSQLMALMNLTQTCWKPSFIKYPLKLEGNLQLINDKIFTDKLKVDIPHGKLCLNSLELSTSNFKISFNYRGKQEFDIPYFRYKGKVNTDLTLELTLEKLKLTGKVTLNRGKLSFRLHRKRRTSSTFNANLNLGLVLRSLRFTSTFLKGYINGELKVSGNIRSPNLYGQLKLEKSYISLGNLLYKVENGQLFWNGNCIPYIDIIAKEYSQWEGGYVIARGSLLSPRINFISPIKTPSLIESGQVSGQQNTNPNLLSELLNRNIDTLNADYQGYSSFVESLTTKLLSEVIEGFPVLDVYGLYRSPLGVTSLRLGKQISPKIFVSYAKTLNTQGYTNLAMRYSLTLEYQLKRGFYLSYSTSNIGHYYSLLYLYRF